MTKDNSDDCLESAEVMKYSIIKRVKLPIITGFFNLKKTDRLLDIGSGGGYFTEKLARRVKEVVSLDISKENIEKAKKLCKAKNISFVLGDATKMKFKDKTFEKILATEIIEHIKNDTGFLREMLRVLKDDGIIVITTPCTNPTISLDKIRKKAGIDMAHAFGHVRPGYTLEQLQRMAENCGAKVTSVKYYHKFFGEWTRIATYAVRNMKSRNRKWNDGSDLRDIGTSPVFSLYRLAYPALYLFACLDKLLPFRGHQIAVKIEKIKS